MKARGLGSWTLQNFGARDLEEAVGLWRRRRTVNMGGAGRRSMSPAEAAEARKKMLGALVETWWKRTAVVFPLRFFFTMFSTSGGRLNLELDIGRDSECNEGDWAGAMAVSTKIRESPVLGSIAEENRTGRSWTLLPAHGVGVVLIERRYSRDVGTTCLRGKVKPVSG